MCLFIMAVIGFPLHTSALSLLIPNIATSGDNTFSRNIDLLSSAKLFLHAIDLMIMYLFLILCDRLLLAVYNLSLLLLAPQ